VIFFHRANVSKSRWCLSEQERQNFFGFNTTNCRFTIGTTAESVSKPGISFTEFIQLPQVMNS
jgi:hypothetical protein